MFPWTVDQYQRYAVLREYLKELEGWIEKINLKEDQAKQARALSQFKNIEVDKEEGKAWEDDDGPNQRKANQKAQDEDLNACSILKKNEVKLIVLDVGGLSPCKDGSGYWLPLEAIWQGFGLSLDLVYVPFKGKRFIQGDALHLPFADRSIDVVAALDVLEHIAPHERKACIEEICRVASHSVIISAPFSSPEIERADKSLFDSIKRIYGIEHRQLKEHLEKGLPKKETISGWLKDKMPAGTEFSFGSVPRWLALQTLRLPFLEYPKRDEIFDLLDRLALNFNQESEFHPPFSRHFWIYSRQLDLRDLESMVMNIQKKLRRQTFPFTFEEALKLNNLLTEFQASKGISALVVSEGNEAYLEECLRHLLSQKIETTFEVSVWLIQGDVSPDFKNKFPGVKFYGNRESRIRLNQLRERIVNLKGKWILLLTDRILLPADSVSFLSRKAMELEKELNEQVCLVHEEAGSMYSIPQSKFQTETGRKFIPVLSPRVIQGKRRYGVWFGHWPGITRILAGRLDNLRWSFSVKDPSWFFSECLFFNKEALFARKGKEGRITKRDIFLWERENSHLKFFYQPEIIVYRKL